MKTFKILISFTLIISLLGCSTTRGSGPQPKYSYSYQQQKYKQAYYPQKKYLKAQRPKQTNNTSNTAISIATSIAGAVVLTQYPEVIGYVLLMAFLFKINE